MKNRIVVAVQGRKVSAWVFSPSLTVVVRIPLRPVRWAVLLGSFMDEGPFHVHLVDLVDGLSAEERPGAERLPAFRLLYFPFTGED